MEREKEVSRERKKEKEKDTESEIEKGRERETERKRSSVCSPWPQSVLAKQEPPPLMISFSGCTSMSFLYLWGWQIKANMNDS